LEIILSKPYFKNKKLRFWDENFFVDIERAKKIIDGMIENNLIMPWETTVRANYLRANMIDDDFMDKLKKSGCFLNAGVIILKTTFPRGNSGTFCHRYFPRVNAT